MDADRDLESLREVSDPFADDVVPELPRMVLPPSPTRADLQRVRFIAAIGALLYEAGFLAMMGTRGDSSTVARAGLIATVTLPLVAAGVALGAASRERVAVGASARRRVAIFIGVPCALFALSALVPRAGVATGSFFTSTAMCLMGTTMLAGGPLVFAVFAYRRAFATAARWRTAALGVACGSLAAAAIELRCTATGVAHVVLGHGPILAIGALVGWRSHA